MTQKLRIYFEDNFINGLLFFGLINIVPGMYGGYIGPQFKRFICSNDYLRTSLLYIFIWFSLSSIIKLPSSGDVDTSDNSILALVVLSFILLFSKQSLNFNIIQSILIIIIYILTALRVQDNFSSPHDNNLKIASNVLLFVLLFFLLLGYYYYYLKQYKDKDKDFSLQTFIIGRKETSKKC